MTVKFEEWVSGVKVVHTLGGDWQVIIDGSSLHDELNKYDQKRRHTFTIGSGFNSEAEASKHATEWLHAQLKAVSAR